MDGPCEGFGGGGAVVIVTFSVPFVHGKQRPRFSRIGEKVRTHTPRETTRNEKRIADAYKGACIRQLGRVVAAPAHVPVKMAVCTRRILPKSRPKRILREPDTYKPDLDNCFKEIKDALNGVAWADDAQVTEVHGFKMPRTRGAIETTYVTVFWEEEDDG